MNQATIRKWSVRKCYEELYDKTDLAPGTRRGDKYMANYWEKLSGNPPVGEITNQTLTQFKQAMLDAGKSPASINSVLKFLRKVLRMLSPQETGNPAGLGIIERRPYTKPVKDIRPIPPRIPLDDLTAFYAACKHATGPRKFVNPTDWWKALIVTAYFTGLRRGDLFRLRHEQIDLERGELRFVASKTGKPDAFPLHPIACEHIGRIWHPISPARRFVFQGFGGGVSLYSQFKRICEAAKLKTQFRLHDIRKTAASEIDRVDFGLGKVFMQHVPKSVTDVHYLNKMPELCEAIAEMRVPRGWQPGVKMQERAARDAIETQEKLRPVDYLAPVKPDGKYWRFDPGRWSFHGSPWFQMPRRNLQVLKLLALSQEPVTIPEIIGNVWPGGSPDVKNLEHSLRSRISVIRKTLRQALGLPASHDPVPCMERGHGGAWSIYLPVEVIDGRWNLMGGKPSEPPLRERNPLIDDISAVHPPKDFWRINCQTYQYRGSEPYRVRGELIELLRILSSASGYVSYFQLAVKWHDGRNDRAARDSVHNRIKKLRDRLRKDLSLPEDFDPVCFTNSIEGGGWSLQMPVEMLADDLAA